MIPETADFLIYHLGRRAAGVHPRNTEFARGCIPIVKTVAMPLERPAVVSKRSPQTRLYTVRILETQSSNGCPAGADGYRFLQHALSTSPMMNCSAKS